MALMASPLFFSSPAQSSPNSVENSERLAQINRATGASSGNTSTYQNRLDAILSTDRSPERAYVVSQETTARENAAAKMKEEQAEALRDKDLSPDRYNPKKVKDNTQIADSSEAKDFKYDGTEKAYQTAKEKIQKEFDERIKKASEQSLEQKTAAKPRESQNALPPSLANNPFYVGDEKDPAQKKFTSRKAVIVSRLVERGISEDDANSAVGQSTSEEDLIVNLMKNYNLSYGDAADAAS